MELLLGQHGIGHGQDFCHRCHWFPAGKGQGAGGVEVGDPLAGLLLESGNFSGVGEGQPGFYQLLSFQTATAPCYCCPYSKEIKLEEGLFIHLHKGAFFHNIVFSLHASTPSSRY